MEIGEKIYHHWFEEGGGIITMTDKGYELQEVPRYGGFPQDVGTFKTLEEAKKEIESHT